MSEEDLIKQLKCSSNLSECKVCGRLFNKEDIDILGHEEEMWVLRISCSACHSQSLLAALIDEEGYTEPTPGGPSPVEGLSDLMETEAEKFKDVIITSDDVLDMHDYLSGFQGDYSELFD